MQTWFPLPAAAVNLQTNFPKAEHVVSLRSDPVERVRGDAKPVLETGAEEGGGGGGCLERVGLVDLKTLRQARRK